MKSSIYIFVFPCLMLLTGCKDNPAGTSSIIPGKIKKEVFSEELFTEYYYKGNLLLKKETTARGEVITSITFDYDKSGKLIRKDEFSTAAGIPLSNYSTYEYSFNNLLLKTNHYPKIGNTYEFRGYTEYEYESGKLVKYSFYNQNDELRNYHILKYDDGNITEDAQYDNNNVLKYLEKFEYDDKLNPLIIDMSIISAFTRSKNNITKWINTFYTVDPPNIYITINNYAYNNFDYPVKCTTVLNRNENGTVTRDTSSSYYEYY